jgi:predicted short-subunit dehydrogenase-like oxidoreductase (DUF2520 family)
VTPRGTDRPVWTGYATEELTQLRLVSRMRELERQNANNPGIPPLGLVGSGRVGCTLERAARSAGLEVRLAGREDIGDACRGAGLVLLCVPDTAIDRACRDVCAAVPSLPFIGHTSGATGLEALAPAAEQGAATLTLHPLQTIPDGNAEITGAPCAVSGSDREALALASELAERLGMRPFEVPEEARAAYHAAACLASNFLVAIEESAAELLEHAGVDDARELLAPLVLRTAANWSELGGDALTGPIARGDEATVRRHLDAIAATDPGLLDVYAALAERTRALAAAQREAAASARPEVQA